MARLILPLTALGYAAPGAVLAVGILIPLAALDHRLADAILAMTGHDPGLLLTGTAVALVLAYMVRFFGIAQGAVEVAFGRVAPSLPMAARSLGQTAGGVLRRIYLPLMRGSISTALLMVFVDCVKELPATLMLRPFNFNTLSTRAYDLASLKKIPKEEYSYMIRDLTSQMDLAAANLEFEKAADLRDLIAEVKAKL